MDDQKLRVGQVFVAGGPPTITYNPRSELNLEDQILDYLDEGHRILSVSGSTKTGKTVLVRRIIPPNDGIWLSGGAISSSEQFWESIAEHLGLFTAIERTSDSKDEIWRTVAGQANIGIAKGGIDKKEITGSTSGEKVTRARNVPTQVREVLRGGLTPLVIDDFHYMPQDVQLEIVRSLKDLVFDGLRVIVIAVPHRAYDVVRVEREMTGRVQQVSVGFWNEDELAGIAHKGFDALKLVDKDGTLITRLAKESFASPHLMQDFCLQLCKANGYRKAQDEYRQLLAPDWSTFFADRASMASKSAFDLLARGPRQRTDRKERQLRSGTITDIYGAVLAAIAHTGPNTELTYEEIRTALKEVLSSDAPQRHEVTRILEEMTKIATNEIEGEPVVDYDVELGKLYISDPYFAFFLRWGVPDLS
ncbi:ATP-binding protein [Streptomyces rhizosphaericus]|uniref:ATP-binding protein n=1 Tax=Streptomyces rhizosphaericus TaxID=114699 RepID=A0A6G4AQV8_9ACTN|nr:ATP-binding protein [Streptomyces rhizosphaericus]NEW75059.1 ATP-binding protein [Streptomyces rhizosphaericus]